MPLEVHTARMGHRDPDWLDITRAGNARRIKAGERGGHRGIGEAFAPSWELLRGYLEKRKANGGELTDLQWLEYRRGYLEEMRQSYRSRRAAWSSLLAMHRVVLVCFCADPTRCHRRVLASDVLLKMGALNKGELTL